MTPLQGDVYWVRFGSSGDSGPSGMRPAVIVQNDLLNRSKVNTTVLSLITSNQKLARVPGNVMLRKGTANLPKPSVVVVSQMAAIDKSRLLQKIGTLPSPVVDEIIAGCQMVLARKVF